MQFRRKWAMLFTVLVTVACTILGAALYFNILPKEKRVTKHLENGYFVDEAGFQRSLLHYLGRSVQSGSRVELLQDGDEIFPAIMEAISLAEHSITIETFEFWGEEVPPKLAAALAERAQAGVKIHFIMDYVGSIGVETDDLERMKVAGVEVVQWRKPSWYRSSRFNHRTHRKLLVIDGRQAFVGGANLADPWLEPHENGGMRDNHFRCSGPVVGELQAAFMDNWVKATGELLLGDIYFPELEGEGDLDTQVVISSPREGTHSIRKLYLLAISGARENLRFSTAFFYPDSMVIDALLDARERGVEIDILAPGEQTEKGWVRYASRNRWGELLEAGVRIHEYGGPMYHAKAIIVDDSFTSIGSSNFANRSFRINDEVNVNIFDRAFTEKMLASYEDDLRLSTTYDAEKWRDRSYRERVIGWMGNLIGPHL